MRSSIGGVKGHSVYVPIYYLSPFENGEIDLYGVYQTDEAKIVVRVLHVIEGMELY